jgi:hypothetical protein
MTPLESAFPVFILVLAETHGRSYLAGVKRMAARSIALHQRLARVITLIAAAASGQARSYV